MGSPPDTVRLDGRALTLRLPADTWLIWEALSIPSSLRSGAACLALCWPDNASWRPKASLRGGDPVAFAAAVCRELFQTRNLPAQEVIEAAHAAREFALRHVPTGKEIKEARDFSVPAEDKSPE